MEYEAPKSPCSICGKTFSGKGMSRHLSSCLIKNQSSNSGEKTGNLFHISAHSSYNRDYFLHFLISEDEVLENIDYFLRETWLECCHHSSSFSRARRGDSLSKSNRIKDIAQVGDTLVYQYDFGSTTELTVKFVKLYKQNLKLIKTVQLLARNAQPIVPCDECHNHPAVEICRDCEWNSVGWLCEHCAKTHKCDHEMFLPVVNSPRAGICAYDGSAEEKEKARATPLGLPKGLLQGIQARAKAKKM